MLRRCGVILALSVLAQSVGAQVAQSPPVVEIHTSAQSSIELPAVTSMPAAVSCFRAAWF